MFYVGLVLELPLEITLLHVVERDDADVGLHAVSLHRSSDLFHHFGDLQVVGVTLPASQERERQWKQQRGRAVGRIMLFSPTR